MQSYIILLCNAVFIQEEHLGESFVKKIPSIGYNLVKSTNIFCLGISSAEHDHVITFIRLSIGGWKAFNPALGSSGPVFLEKKKNR